MAPDPQDPTDEELDTWRMLFIMYRNHGKGSLSADDYALFKHLTKKLGKLLANVK
jgi:hypothetical protein